MASLKFTREDLEVLDDAVVDINWCESVRDFLDEADEEMREKMTEEEIHFVKVHLMEDEKVEEVIELFKKYDIEYEYQWHTTWAAEKALDKLRKIQDAEADNEDDEWEAIGVAVWKIGDLDLLKKTWSLGQDETRPHAERVKEAWKLIEEAKTHDDDCSDSCGCAEETQGQLAALEAEETGASVMAV